MLCVTDCARPLGLEENKNKAITIRSPASSTDPAYPPNAARLNGPSAWCPSTTPAYLQIDLDKTYKLTAIATQGGTARNKWVQRYTISFNAGVNNIYYTESRSKKVRSAELLYFHCSLALQQYPLTKGLIDTTTYKQMERLLFYILVCLSSLYLYCLPIVRLVAFPIIIAS